MNADWPNDVAFIAEVMPDWTTLQLPSGKAYAFNRESGRVYQLPHRDCPFAIIPAPKNTRPAPTEAEVEAAAKRIFEAGGTVSLSESMEWGHYLRMARAALGFSSTTAISGTHCATCACNPGMTKAIRFDVSPTEAEGEVRAKLIEMGWTPPPEKGA